MREYTEQVRAKWFSDITHYVICIAVWLTNGQRPETEPSCLTCKINAPTKMTPITNHFNNAAQILINGKMFASEMLIKISHASPHRVSSLDIWNGHWTCHRWKYSLPENKLEQNQWQALERVEKGEQFSKCMNIYLNVNVTYHVFPFQFVFQLIRMKVVHWKS